MTRRPPTRMKPAVKDSFMVVSRPALYTVSASDRMHRRNVSGARAAVNTQPSSRRSSGVSRTSAAATFSSRCAVLEVPGMTSIAGERASSHARAAW
jgi:hypothetical protein